MQTRTRTRKREQKDEPFNFLDGYLMKTESIETVYPALKAQSSRQSEDEFSSTYAGFQTRNDFQVLEPLYNPQTLNRYAIASGVLKTCIDAMATNIDGFGYTLEYIGEEGQQDSQEATEEFDRVTGVLDHPNGEYSLIDLRKRFRVDKESCGFGTLEIIRNEEDGFPDIIHHVPSYTVRMTVQDKERTDSFRYMPRPGANNNMMTVQTRFRRYVQMNGGTATFFRENGDVRMIDSTTGLPKGGARGNAEDLASDILLDAQYAPGSRYGAPRWIGELRSVLGMQESENTNLGYFKDNGIPAMMLMVLGGAMSESSQRDFQTLVQQSRGPGMQNKIVMIEIKGDEMAASDKGQIQRPEVKLEPLLQVRQQDAFFQNYEMNSAKKIRSSFRLPAILTGLTEEVTYAVAQASLTLAESQIFAPERNQTDDLFNYQILTYNGEPMRYWRYKSNPPRIQDAEEIMTALNTLEGVGAMTPNIAIEFANSLFDANIPLIDEDWGDMPFSLTLSREAGKESDKSGGTTIPALPAPQAVEAVKNVRRRVRSVKAADEAPTARRRVRKSVYENRAYLHGKKLFGLRTLKKLKAGYGSRGAKAGSAMNDPKGGTYVDEREELEKRHE